MKSPCLKVIGSVLAAACLSVSAASVAAQQATAPMTLAEAFGVLAGEQSLGESYASLLKAVGKDDFQGYADGIRRYASAKAAFDALITQLHQELRTGEGPGRSEALRMKLDTAVSERVAFTRHVEAMVASLSPSTPRAIGAALEEASQLVKLIGDSAMAIWKEYRRIEEADRKDTLSRLDALKWKGFHEIAG